MLTADHLKIAACRLWGQPTTKKANEWRFGKKGSKSIKINDLVWFDHETGEHGGVVDLCELAGIGAEDKGRERDNSSSEIVYRYLDEHGVCLFEVVRLPGHKFFQRKPDRTPGIKGIRRVIYRLPELVKTNGLVFVTEGEKDADNLAALGVMTTTNPGGAGKWRAEYSEFLRDRDVVILPDNDDAGRDHARKVSDMLFGVAKSIKVLMLPGLGDKEDVSDWIKRGGNVIDLMRLVEALEEETAPPEWHHQLMTGKSGEPLANVANAYIALANDPALKDLFRFDLMRLDPMIVRSQPKKVEDDDIIDIQRYLQFEVGLTRIGRNTTNDAINNYARDRAYHPLREFYDDLKVNGTERLDHWLTDFLGCEDNPYVRSVGRWWLLQMIARVYEPGCQADYMLILEGPQGELKSTACRILAGDDYFSDSLSLHDIGKKDASLHLRGKAIIEFSELDGISKVEASQLKAFVTRTHERYRPPYAAVEVIEPRQCVFVGTCNKDTYLRDETGGRRFWPVKCGDIDIAGLRSVRDLLLAEAVARYKAGERRYPDREFERQYITPEQEARYEFDEWYETVEAYIRPLSQTTIVQIAQSCLNIPIDRLGRPEQMRIAAILRKLGWILRRTMHERRYVPGRRLV